MALAAALRDILVTAVDLVLWRHAQAQDGTPDEARALSAKGTRQAERVAAWLRERIAGHVTLLASPAARAQQTAQAYGAAIRTRSELAPDATPERILGAAGWPHGDGTVIVVGHQPALGAAAALMLTGRPAPWDIKKGGVWWLRSRSGAPPLVVAVITPRLARCK